MGWNNIEIKNNLLFEGVENQTQFYFVHSYFIEYNATFGIATADYGLKFSAAIQKDNFYGVQFHPEKSGAAGDQGAHGATAVSVAGAEAAQAARVSRWILALCRTSTGNRE